MELSQADIEGLLWQFGWLSQLLLVMVALVLVIVVLVVVMVVLVAMVVLVVVMVMVVFHRSGSQPVLSLVPSPCLRNTPKN